MSDPGMMGESGFDKRLADNVRRLDEKSGYIQDLLSEKIDHLRSEVYGNDKRYAERFAAQESASRYAQDKSNEFRGSLDDVGKKQMPRTEAEAMFKSSTEKIEAGLKAVTEKVDSLQGRLDRNDGRGTMVDPLVAQLAKDVASLTTTRDQGSGDRTGRVTQQQLIQWILMVILALFGIAAYIRK